ncbi:MAG: pyruvate dehydrogenase [Bdellovibrionales bacterium]|nr:pyruvate dehydrogenase [Bdellovibrionales bacterium]
MAQSALSLKTPPALPSPEVLDRIIRRVQSHAMSMIYLANHRANIEKGDPKVGGHPSACSSALHILSALHLIYRNPQDYVACKPHASPVDHAANYLLKMFHEQDGSPMSEERSRIAMRNLRHFSANNEPVFQSYHSVFDPDHWSFLPSGSVGIPPVAAVYFAHAYKVALAQGYKVPLDAHFWSVIGDSEFREGSLMEVTPEAAERGLGNVTWIVDYNRQSLDGVRILNESGLGGKDSDRIERTMEANGWEVFQVRHGAFRNQIFAAQNGDALREVMETGISDYEYQSLLVKRDAKAIVEAVGGYDKGAQKALKALGEDQVIKFWRDLGGHDVPTLLEAFAASKRDQDRPTMLVVHTLKGWNLKCEGVSTNHSAMLAEDEVHALRKANGMTNPDLTTFEYFDASTPEAKYLKARSDWMLEGREACKKLRVENMNIIRREMEQTGALADFPKEVGINLKLVPLVHTQWMLGQISAKLARIGDTPLEDAKVEAPKKALTPAEKKLKTFADIFMTMAPDVATSTNLNASIDGRVFGPETEDFETEYGVKDSKSPDIVPHESARSRHIRFDIAEGNAMTCAGTYGKVGDYLGVPFLPLMTVYDFFIKRALDQLFYNLYWNSSFILVGTPSGVTLSPEGAQHAWKSDIQIANGISWEPAYAQELDWIIAESARRHIMSYLEGKDSPNGNAGRSGVIIRGVTRSLEQKEFLARLKTHKRFAGQSDEAIMEATRKDCLEGGYYLVDYRGFDGYRPSENVVHIFTMGSLVTEAMAASDALAKEGIFANVIQVSSSDLLLGSLAEKNNHRHLRQGLGVTGDLYLNLNGKAAASNGSTAYPPAQFGPKPLDTITASGAGAAQLLTLGGRRIPVVSVHDGEPGLLDNIGSIVGTVQKTLAVRKHSKSGIPSDIFKYHGLDSASVMKAAKQVLEESAFSGVRVDASVAQLLSAPAHS